MSTFKCARKRRLTFGGQSQNSMGWTHVIDPSSYKIPLIGREPISSGLHTSCKIFGPESSTTVVDPPQPEKRPAVIAESTTAATEVRMVFSIPDERSRMRL